MKLFYLALLFLAALLPSPHALAGAADIVADYTSGCSPLVVHFNAATHCAACSYSWRFGNATPPASGDTVSTTYIGVGTYTATLTVHSGAAVDSQSVVITVYPTPSVSFAAADTAVCPGAPVNFSNSSTSSAPGAMQYTWNYGDGSPTDTGAAPAHAYAVPGYKNVTLVVANSQGCISTLTKPHYIHIYTPPVSAFSAGAVSACNPPAGFTFTSASTGMAPLGYGWAFGDGGTSAAANPAYTYTAAGTYPVRLVTTDGHGCTDTLTRPAYIQVRNVLASFTYHDPGCVRTPVTFTNTSGAHAYRSWNYGDGNPITSDLHGVHVYSATGTYSVSLTIFDGVCSNTVTHVVHIITLNADFTMAPKDPCPAPATVTYTASGSPWTDISWTFKNGIMAPQTGTGSVVANTYMVNGEKIITMIMKDTVSGCRDTVVKRDTIYDLRYLAFPTPVSRGCAPLTTGFEGVALTTAPDDQDHPYPLPVSAYAWNFGDGSPIGTDSTPAHTFTAAGSYTVSVQITTSNGCTAIAMVPIEVGIAPTATFTATPRHICFNRSAPVTFTATVTSGTVDFFQWDYGEDNDVDTGHVHDHVYLLPGVFTVTLTPYYHGCADTSLHYVLTDYITIDSPKAIITPVSSCTAYNRTTFTNGSLGADSLLWIFGDGFTSTLNNPVHENPPDNPYEVLLATYNIHSGCRDTDRRTFDFTPVAVDFTANDRYICKYGKVHFQATLQGAHAQSYRWYFNDTLRVDTTSPDLVYTFNRRGIYSVRLVIVDAIGCEDTATRLNFITVGKPTPVFTVSPSSGCLPLTVTLTDNSYDVAGVPIDSFRWKFGDGGLESAHTPAITHTYTAAGTYTITDIATDTIGCADTAIYPAFIKVNKAQASFFTTNAHPCPGAPVSFTNVSPAVVSAVWSFGDGGGAAFISPAHSYNDIGVYNVQLAITDTNGCRDTAVYAAYIAVSKPDASFTLSDKSAICAPVTVNFTNSSTGAISYSWLFGDGNTSVVASPSDLYTAPGLYNVQLIAANQYGCKDTAAGSINIFGYAGAFSYSVVAGCSPLTVHFASSFANVSGITWDFADGNTSSLAGADTISHTYTTAGGFVPKLILSDNSGCQSTSIGADTIKVDAVVARFGTVPGIICAGSLFHFSDSSTVRWSPITAHSWAYDGTTSSAAAPYHTINTAGTYPVHLVVTNGWGCTDTANKNIIIYATPNVTAGNDTVICTGDTAMLYAHGALTYSWSPPATVACTTCSTTRAFPMATTSYIIRGTDVRGCSDTASVRVQTFVPAIASAAAICVGDATSLSSASAGGTWLSGNTSVATIGSSSGTVTGVAAGIVTITYALGGGCMATVPLTVNALPVAGSITGAARVCVSASVTLSSTTPAGTWSSSNGSAAISPAGANELVTGITAGADTITYTVNNGCGSATATHITIVAPLPVASGGGPICAGASLPLTATITGGTWSSGSPAIAMVDALSGIAIGADIAAAGAAIITYTTVDGCIDTTLVTVYSIPAAGILSGPASVCRGAAFALVSTVGGSSWSSGNTAIALIDSSSGTGYAIDTGTVTITYTTQPNDAGCADTAYFALIVILQDFSVSGTVADVSCYAGHDGRIGLAIAGGSAPFVYQWSNNSTDNALSDIDTGKYYVRVTETITSCAATDTFHVAQPDSLYTTARATKDVCKTAAGSISTTVTGGIAPYSYLWSNNAAGSEITGLLAGIYTLSVTDMKGCVERTEVVVEDTSCTGIVVRNGISANGDGINDTWLIEGLQYYPHNTVQVFDKWGDEVYEHTNYQNDWTGVGKNGVMLPDGSYYYLLKLNEPSKTGGSDTFTGTLLIKR